MQNENRSSFSGKIGFVLAAAGSAVGLGNIWRFPYLAAKYGGGIFLLTYLILALTFGFALMTAEIAIGRKTKLSVVGAFSSLDKRFSFLGYLAALVPAIILPYYSVIGGWVMKYMFAFGKGSVSKVFEGGYEPYFNNFITGVEEPLGWFLLFVGLTALIVWFGVEKGVEKVSKIMMPILVILTIFIAGFVLCQERAMEGVKYYLLPDFSKFSVKTVLAAMGQLFYSMSLAMGIMITYGSYMKKQVSIETSVKQIEYFDTGIAFLAGLMIIPAIFFNAPAGTIPDVNKGPGLMFIELPGVFAHMGAVGRYVGLSFFVMVFFAALTSSISLMETVVSIVCDKFRVGRKTACVIVIALSLILGIPSCLGYGALSSVTIIGMAFLDFFDFITNSVMMPAVALITCVFVGYIIKPRTIVEEVELTGKFRKKALFNVIIKYVAPVCIVLILISSVLDALANVIPALKMFRL